MPRYFPPSPVVIQDLHLKSSPSLSNFIPDVSHSNNPHCCPCDIHSHNGCWQNGGLRVHRYLVSYEKTKTIPMAVLYKAKSGTLWWKKLKFT